MRLLTAPITAQQMGRGIITAPSLQSVGGWSPSYLFLDRFTTVDAAPLALPRTSEPGPGAWSLAAGDANQLSISGSELIYSGGATVDIDISTPSIASRVVGESILCDLRYAPATSDVYVIMPVGAAINDIMRLNGNNLLVQSNLLAETLVASTQYYLAVILRSTGSFALIKGGAFTEWTMAWISSTSNSVPSPRLDCNSAAGNISIDNYRIVDLPSPWNSDYGVATSRLAGNRSAGDTFAHKADCLIEFTVGTLPGGDMILHFRKQDSNNYWRIVVNAAGLLALQEVVSGSPTTRGQVVGAVSNGDKFVIRAVGTSIKVYEYPTTLHINYGSASNFQTATSGALDTLAAPGVVSDIVAWPRVVSGAALSILSKA